MVVTEIYRLQIGEPCLIPLSADPVQAGFPSPADDHLDEMLDLNEHLIKNPLATFMVRAKGNSMIDVGIQSGDLLVVDKSLDATDGDVVIAMVDGHFTVKTYRKTGRTLRLVAENPAHPPIAINEDSNVEIWGVVTNVIHSTRRSR